MEAKLDKEMGGKLGEVTSCCSAKCSSGFRHSVFLLGATASLCRNMNFIQVFSSRGGEKKVLEKGFFNHRF